MLDFFCSMRCVRRFVSVVVRFQLIDGVAKRDVLDRDWDHSLHLLSMCPQFSTKQLFI